MNKEHTPNINWIDPNYMDKPKIIHELREKEIINNYGEVHYEKLLQEYGEQKTKEIHERIIQEDIYKTYTLDELYNIAITIVQDIRIRLMKKNVFMYDVEDLKQVIHQITLKEEEEKEE